MNVRKWLTVLGYPVQHYGTCMFAVISRCNARCSFCGFWQLPHVANIPLPQAIEAIDRLYDMNVRYIQFTGGETLLYPHLHDCVLHASKKGILATVVTNGSLLSTRRIKELKEAGIQGITISTDHWQAEILERNRGIPGLTRKIARAVEEVRAAGIPVQASATISNLLRLEDDDFRRLVEHNQRLGFDGTYFCYPMPSVESSYAIGGETVKYEPEELMAVLVHLQELKRQRYPIDNSFETLEAAQDNVQGRPSRFPCVAGHKVFYLDWNLTLYRCMTKSENFGNILSLDPDKLTFPRLECEDCLLSCDREPSIYHHGIRSVPPFIQLVRDTVQRGVPL